MILTIFLYPYAKEKRQHEISTKTQQKTKKVNKVPISPIRKQRINDATAKYKFLTKQLINLVENHNGLAADNLHFIHKQVLLIIDARCECNDLYSRNGDLGHKTFIWRLLELCSRIYRVSKTPNKKDSFLIRHFIDCMH